MFKSDEENFIYEKKRAELLYCAKCGNCFVVKKVSYDKEIKTLAYEKEESTIKFCPYCGWEPK